MFALAIVVITYIVPVLIVLAAVVVILAIIIVVRALALRPATIKDPLPLSKARGGENSVDRFRALLRVPTVWGAELSNPDRKSFDEFLPTLQHLYPRVFEHLELTLVNTYGIMLRWKGADPTAQPVVLMAHHDVVEAKPEEWTHDPFAAEIIEGRIYARGAVDTKCILAALFESVDTLLAESYTPPRDIYLCSSNCEEDMGDTAPAMVQLFKDRGITPLLVLDEGGAVIDKAPLGINQPFAAVGVSEKGICNARLKVSSPGGHAATPSLEDAPSKLVCGLNKMLNNPAPAALSPPIKAMLKEVASRANFGLRLVFANLWIFSPLVLAIMKKDHETAAMVRSTYALTKLEGSKTVNVIPQQAEAGINIRIDPLESVELVLDRLKTYFGDDLEITSNTASEPSPISPFDDEVFGYLRKIIHSIYPEAGIAPYVQSSASDARHFALICPHTYRFAGFLFKSDQRASVHGQDENLDVESYLRGVGFYLEFIRHLDMLEG